MDRIRIEMTPHPDDLQGKEHSGIAQVVLNWAKHLPRFGIDVVAQDDPEPADLSIGHSAANIDADIHVSHGLLWTEEMELGQYAYEVNADLVRAATYAKAIITPSEWVADVYRRDLRVSPHVIGHGVNVDEWQHDYDRGEYILYAKNRTKDGLDPSLINDVALALPYFKFYTTFATKEHPPNVITYGGTVPFSEMKRHIMQAGVLFMPDRETWGIVAAEALAAGIPVVSTDAGAVKEFVEHGKTGYLYKNRNFNDAVQGIKYALSHAPVLGDNGKIVAENTLDWKYSIEKIAGVIRQTYWDMLSDQKLINVNLFNTVAVVITSHNYGHSVGRAIESVLAQSYTPDTVIVVDDNSEDNTKEIVDGFDGVKYIRVDVQNVALARNAGIYSTDCRFVLTLDGDDYLRPDFIKHCIEPLLKDHRVGFAYTGTEVYLEDTGKTLMPMELIAETGKKAHRPWPTMDFDKQFMPGYANQFPATVIFRREALLRVGGYRARYAPLGAGTEDANIYLRLLACGWQGSLVEPTVNNLWVHVHGKGHVSGDPSYKEVDWRAWAPYTRDFRFPFAAAATPKRLSHPVRSYEPKVSVIIPVGPGHESSLKTALDSLEAQTYRDWEAIVVWDFDPGAEILEYYRQAYPHVRRDESYARGYWEGVMLGAGPGRARNIGVDIARAQYVTFLDADDYYSPDFLTHMNPDAVKEHDAIIYSQYFSRMLKTDHPRLGGNIVRDEGDTVVVNYSFRPYDKARANAEPEGDRPYVWAGVNVMLDKTWHNDVGGFDETLQSWEDCLYLLQLAWAGHDFHMIERSLWVYSFVDGTRREYSVDHQDELMTYFKKKHGEAHAL